MDFLIREFNPELDMPERVRLFNHIKPEAPSTLLELQEWERLRPNSRIELRLVAERDGRVLGMCSMTRDTDFPEGQFLLRSMVYADVRRQGIGERLLNTALEFAILEGASSIKTDARDDDAANEQFALKRGFVTKHKFFTSVLDLGTFDQNRFADVIGHVLAQGIVLTDLERWGDTTEHRWRWWDVFHATLNDAPGDPFDWTFEDMQSRMLESKFFAAAGVRLALENDQVIAYSTADENPEQNESYNYGTGVKREHRRLGLALALKLESIAWARARGSKRMVTFNESQNLAMLQLNQKLGFVPQVGTLEMVKRLEG